MEVRSKNLLFPVAHSCASFATGWDAARAERPRDPLLFFADSLPSGVRILLRPLRQGGKIAAHCSTSAHDSAGRRFNPDITNTHFPENERATSY
jgi:hypothetical protein